MFLTVTLNAAIDKTLRVANLQIGRRHRCAPGDLQAGGKGINVARALRALGQPVVATGLAGGRAGDMIVEDLTAGGIVHQFVRIADESRSSTIVLDPAGTQVGRPRSSSTGPIVRPDELETFAVVLQLPAGRHRGGRARRQPARARCPRTGTRPRCARPAGSSVFTVLDSEGEPLRLGLARRARPRRAQPDGGRGARRLRVRDDAGFRARARADRRDGRARRRDHARRRRARARAREPASRCFLRATIPLLEVVSPVGAGDALLAGLLAARRAERPFAEALRYAVACGAASTQHEQPGMLDPREVQRLSAARRGRRARALPRPDGSAGPRSGQRRPAC